MCPYWSSLCLRFPTSESQHEQDVQLPSTANGKLIERYVQRLHEQIRLLQDELSNKHGEVGSDTSKSPVRRTSGYGEQTVELSSPLIGFMGSATPTPAYHSPNGEPISRSILNRTRSDENTRYEWNEGGDEKESGTDAMGTGFKGEGYWGFFGTSFCTLTYSRWILDIIIRRGDKSCYFIGVQHLWPFIGSSTIPSTTTATNSN